MAILADFATVASVSLGVSASDVSGVVGLDVVVEKGGLNNEVKDGDGGNGVGGRL